MAGQKPAYTRQALALLADHLESADQLAVVVYDDQVQTLLASAPVVAKDPIKALLSGIESGGSTNLSGGLAAGMQQAAPHVAPDRVTRVLLLTDGLANVGVTDPDTLTAWTRTWRERGIALSTLGVGDDFNEDLLVALAEAGGGNFHYIAVLADARPRCPLRLGILVQQSLARRIAAGVRRAGRTRRWRSCGPFIRPTCRRATRSGTPLFGSPRSWPCPGIPGEGQPAMTRVMSSP